MLDGGMLHVGEVWARSHENAKEREKDMQTNVAWRVQVGALTNP
jgi:hypothetical protein